MTRRFNLLFVPTLVFAMCATTLMAQPLMSEQTSDDVISSLTKDPSTYSPKPKDMWQVGVHGGYLGSLGDNPLRTPVAGFGGGVSVRKSLGYTFSLRGEFVTGTTYGQDYYLNPQGTLGASRLRGNLDGNGNGYSDVNPFVFNNRTTYTSLGLQAIYTFSNIKFHSTAPKLGIYGLLGLNAFRATADYDALDSNGDLYDFAAALQNDRTALGTGAITEREYRKAAVDVLGQIMDGEYETSALGDDVEFGFGIQVGIGASYRISDKISIAIEPQSHLVSSDLIDGRRFRTQVDLSNAADVPFYIPVRLNIFLGDVKKKSIPLWWVNPLDGPMDILGTVPGKLDRDELLVDKDNDGVPDMLDKELDSPAGAQVDTRGVTLDSDKDGLPNHLDKEPYSPVGYKIDPQTGISEKPKMPKTMTKEEVLAIGEEAGWGTGDISDWFLPMIHFDNDRYSIKPQAHSALNEVAEVMKRYPSIIVVVEGHASSDASTKYNTLLSYKRANAAVNMLVENYGISRSRLILRYNGESAPLIKNNTTNYMNRRVEFRVANGESEMNAPE
jgi:outer membrane protein OmpA-like peptidoglycan-associated protein